MLYCIAFAIQYYIALQIAIYCNYIVIYCIAIYLSLPLLVYMDMCPPTDSELNEGQNQLLPLILTSDTKWILSCLDLEPGYDTYFDVIFDPSELGYDTPFDDYGKYIGNP